VPLYQEVNRVSGHSQDQVVAAAWRRLWRLLRPPHPPRRPVGRLQAPHGRLQPPASIQWAAERWRPGGPGLHLSAAHWILAPFHSSRLDLNRLAWVARKWPLRGLLRVLAAAPPAVRPIGRRRCRFFFPSLTQKRGVDEFAPTDGWVSSGIPTHMPVGGQWRCRWPDRSTG